MPPTNADFGRRLYTKKTSTWRAFVWMLLGGAIAALPFFVPPENNPDSSRPRDQLMTHFWPRGRWAVGALGAVVIALGARHVAKYGGKALHFYELGACAERRTRRQWLLYSDVETVSYDVRTEEGRLSRSLDFAGPGGQPRIHLWTNSEPEEPGNDGTVSAAEMQDVSRRVVKAVASKMVTGVLDQGEAVAWTGRLWLTPQGLRVGGEQTGKLVPWTVIDGVKDGSQTGRIEVFGFGEPKPVAAARTADVNAMPGFEAFMELLERAQRSKAA